MGQLIALVGVSGVGKTSLARALRAAHPFNVGLEQHAERPFQALFKMDTRYALANQVDYLLLRAEQERDLRRATETGLVDGGLDQDFHAFTRLFRIRNYLGEAEFDLCRRLYETIRASQPLPDLVIALKASDEEIRRRLAERDRINIASAEDNSLLESFLDDWLASLAPERVLRLEVSAARPDYSDLAPALLTQLRARLGLDAGTFETGYIP
jgi:deoxyadenosine/deoxycytidine kinase